MVGPICSGYRRCALSPVGNFGITSAGRAVGLVCSFYGRSIGRSLGDPTGVAEFRTRLPSLAAAYLILVAVRSSANCSLRDRRNVRSRRQGAGGQGGVSLASVRRLTASQTLAAIAAPVAAIVTFFRQQIGGLLKARHRDRGHRHQSSRPLGKVAIWIAGAALPLLIWVGYLYLCYWGIINDKPRPQAAAGNAGDDRSSGHCPKHGRRSSCSPLSLAPAIEAELTCEQGVAEGQHTPSWMINRAGDLSAFSAASLPAELNAGLAS